MYLQFVAKSHLFFTAGKDSKIKQWDADKFEHIQTLEVGGFGAVKRSIIPEWAACPSGAGSCSQLFSPVCHTGASQGSVVFGTQSQWRLPGVLIP